MNSFKRSGMTIQETLAMHGNLMHLNDSMLNGNLPVHF
jgi:hypothetical protein